MDERASNQSDAGSSPGPEFELPLARRSDAVNSARCSAGEETGLDSGGE